MNGAARKLGSKVLFLVDKSGTTVAKISRTGKGGSSRGKAVVRISYQYFVVYSCAVNFMQVSKG